MQSLQQDRAGRGAKSLRAAEEYIAAGWEVLPLRPGKKTPLTTHGHKDATRDLATVRQWFRRFPMANIGIRTGAASGGPTVIDIDPRNGGTVDEAWPATRTVATASGGQHRYYLSSASLPSSAGRLAPGVDVRADDGYVVAPGSRTESGSWEWINPGAPIVPLPPAVAALAATPTLRAGAGVEQSGSGFVQRERVGTGERNAYIASAAGAMFARGYEHHEVEHLMRAENTRACVPPLDRSEVDGITASVERYHR